MIENTESENIQNFEQQNIAQRNGDKQWEAFCKHYFNFNQLESNLAKQLFLSQVKTNTPILLGVAAIVVPASICLAVFCSPFLLFIPAIAIMYAIICQPILYDECKKSVRTCQRNFNYLNLKPLTLFSPKNSNKKIELEEGDRRKSISKNN